MNTIKENFIQILLDMQKKLLDNEFICINTPQYKIKISYARTVVVKTRKLRQDNTNIITNKRACFNKVNKQLNLHNQLSYAYDCVFENNDNIEWCQFVSVDYSSSFRFKNKAFTKWKYIHGLFTTTDLLNMFWQFVNQASKKELNDI